MVGLSIATLAVLTSCSTPPQSNTPPSSAGALSSQAISSAAIDVQKETTSGNTLDIGKASAPLQLLVFTNHACTYCREFWQDRVPQLKQRFVDPGKLRLSIAILPIGKYPTSALETSALFCAQKEGKGLSMHDALFSLYQRKEASIIATAKNLKMDPKTFGACLHSPEAVAYAQAQANLAKSLNVTLVPTFFLGNDKRVGLLSTADLRRWIESALSH
jgi:protein-disulfide isomerase